MRIIRWPPNLGSSFLYYPGSRRANRHSQGGPWLFTVISQQHKGRLHSTTCTSKSVSARCLERKLDRIPVHRAGFGFQSAMNIPMSAFLPCAFQVDVAIGDNVQRPDRVSLDFREVQSYLRCSPRTFHCLVNQKSERLCANSNVDRGVLVAWNAADDAPIVDLQRAVQFIACAGKVVGQLE